MGLEAGPVPAALLLDVSGCAHLWGDEGGLLAAVEQRFVAAGYTVRLGLADTLGAAWALAHFSHQPLVSSTDSLEASLRPLPVAALRVGPDVVEQLQRFGLETMGSVLDLPRSSLASRFGRELPQRLEQALGLVPELLEPERFAAPWVEAWRGEDCLVGQDAFQELFQQLLARVLARLQGQRLGLLEWRCQFLLAAAEVVWEFRLSRPSTDEKHLATLFRLRCERDGLPGASDGLRLAVLQVGVLKEQQTALFDTDHSQARAWASLLDRLSQRLGDAAVLQPEFPPDPLPERACRWRSALGESQAAPVPVGLGLQRPSRLLTTPQPLQVMSSVPEGPPRRVFQQQRPSDVRHHWGPERIESGWWRTQDIRRDYYRIELDTGHHWWIFRDRATHRWFVHGYFD